MTMEKEEIIKENIKRLGEISAVYNPITGEGSTSVARQWTTFEGFPVENINLPTTMLKDERVQQCIDIIGEQSKRRTEIVPSTASYDVGRYSSFPVEVEIGGATIFVLDVEKFIKQ